MTRPSLTQGLWTLATREAAPADLARARLHLLDWLGCALAGWAGPTGRRIAAVLAPGGNPFALRGPEGAMAMGALGSLLEMDDVHRTALLHPGPVVMPAVLAAAGEDSTILPAILAGYEAMIRLGAAVGPAHYAMFHNTATCGGIGAAAGAARVMGLDADQAVGAMGQAMSLAGGLWQARHEPVATKHLHVAEAARRGVQAALLAQGGLPGPRYILDGPQGFFAALAPDGRPDLVLHPASQWTITEVSFKPWPACRHAHPAIDAALLLPSRPPGQITVRTYADAVTFCDKPNPGTEAEARFSLQHAVAVVLARGRPTLADFAEPALNAPDLAALRARITVQDDPAMTAAYPAHFGAEVSLAAGGKGLAARVADAWGDPEVPMDEAAVVAKFETLAATAVPPATAAALSRAVMGIAETGPGPLRAALARVT
jgi:2-methylcitrate dehydratase PrpD